MQGSPDDVLKEVLFPVCPQIAVDSGTQGRWYLLRRAFEHGGALLTFGVFTVTGHATGI